jgi:Rps23 Pro-64 3,4-dihydroxylase Tpa1-like proline 4-hydroxylase
MTSNDINIIENFLSDEDCDYVLNKCKSELTLSEIDIYNGIFNRKQKSGRIDDLGFVNLKLKNILKTLININGMEVSDFIHKFKFAEYKLGDYFDWHTDNSTSYTTGFITTIIQLNDDYVGGNFEIKNSNNELIPIKNKKGSLYVFNSALLHRVTEIEFGVRYSLSNWFSLVKTNKTKQNLI